MKRKIPSMNDKCAGGTGDVIDEIGAGLRLTGDTLAESRYFGVELHRVAGKCGDLRTATAGEIRTLPRSNSGAVL